jgi:putative SOS response-associated peptidase YedK
MKITSKQQQSENQLEMQVYPHGDFPVVTQRVERRIEIMRYSLIPRWAKVEKPKFATYNARVETMSEKAHLGQTSC